MDGPGLASDIPGGRSDQPVCFTVLRVGCEGAPWDGTNEKALMGR